MNNTTENETPAMKVDLIRKTRVGRVLTITVPSGQYAVEYKGSGFSGESVLVDGVTVARKTSAVKMVPLFEFAVGQHRGVIEIRTKLWRDLFGPILGRLESFSLEIDGQTVYHDIAAPPSLFVRAGSLTALGILVIAGLVVRSSSRSGRAEFDPGYRPAPHDAWVLDVPYVSQESVTDCVPACVAMMLQYHDVFFDMSKLDQEFATGTVSGSHMHRVMAHLTKLGAEPILSYPLNVRDLIDMVQRGFPVLAAQELLDGANRSVHAVVVLGVTQGGNALILHDPFYGQGVSLDKKTFDRRWLKGGGYTRTALILRANHVAQLEGLSLVGTQIAEFFEEGRFYLESGEIDNAIASFQATLQTAPKFIPGFLYLGSCLAQEDRNEEAERVLSAALELDESYYWGIARAKLAGAQLLTGKKQSARVNFEKFLDAKPMELPTAVSASRKALAFLDRQQESSP